MLKKSLTFALLAAAAAAPAAATSVTIAEITTSVGSVDFVAKGDMDYSATETIINLEMSIGGDATGKVTLKPKITIKYPSCDTAETEASLTGTMAIKMPSSFSSVYDTAQIALSSLPDLSEVEFTIPSKGAGPGEALTYDLPSTTEMKLTGTGANLAVNLPNLGIMDAGLKVPFALQMSVMDTDRVDVTVPCGGESKPCAYSDYGVSCGGTTPCKVAYCTMCSGIESAFSDPIMNIDLDVWKVFADAAAGTDAASMFVDCPGTGSKKCLAVGDVSGECTSASTSLDSGDKKKADDSAAAGRVVGTAAVALAGAAVASVFH